MQVNEMMFPSDVMGELGNLRTSLTRALQSADTSESAAKLLASTLAFAASKLRTVYKEDGIVSKSQEARNRAERKAGEKRTADLVAEAKKKLAKEAKDVSSKKGKVQTLKLKATK